MRKAKSDATRLSREDLRFLLAGWQRESRLMDHFEITILETEERQILLRGTVHKRQAESDPTLVRLHRCSHWLSTRPSITACIPEDTLEKKSKPVIAST